MDGHDLMDGQNGSNGNTGAAHATGTQVLRTLQRNGTTAHLEPVAAAEHAWAERSESAERDLLFLSASSLTSSLSDSIADSRIGCNVMSNSKVSSVTL